jgi:hypothetical protein|tara:strand:- start:49 stop:762 length:714 start_codon:yes stop_codon:yes gene_type:complete
MFSNIADNKLRIQLLIQVLLLTYTGGTLSWMHRVHLFVQPLIFFCTLDHSWSKAALWILLFATGLDILVLVSALTVVSRCVSNINPGCVQQSLTEVVVTIVAAVHVVNDVFQVLNLSTQRPTNSNAAGRLCVISWFLFVQDVCWLTTSPEGLEWGILAHPVFNMLVFWVSSSKDAVKFYILVGLAGALVVFDSYILLQMDLLTDTVASMFLAMYILTDMMIAFFALTYGEKLNLVSV